MPSSLIQCLGEVFQACLQALGVCGPAGRSGLRSWYFWGGICYPSAFEGERKGGLVFLPGAWQGTALAATQILLVEEALSLVPLVIRLCSSFDLQNEGIYPLIITNNQKNFSLSTRKGIIPIHPSASFWKAPKPLKSTPPNSVAICMREVPAFRTQTFRSYCLSNYFGVTA